MSDELIAVGLGLEIETVRQLLKGLFGKAGVHSQAGLAALVRSFAT